MAIRDPRTFIRIDTGIGRNRKISRAGGDAGWLHVCAICHCGDEQTDGLIPKAIVPQLSDRKAPMKLAAKLVTVGAWHEAGHDCDRCLQPASEQK